MEKIIKTKFIIINKNQEESKILKKEKIQELITQNEEYIKNYEAIKEKTDNPLKKKECDILISKYRKNQVRLHNKLHNLNSLLNVNDSKNMIRAKSQYENKNNLYMKEYLNYKNSYSLKSSFNFDKNLFTKNNNNKFLFKKPYRNNNLSMNKISDLGNNNNNKNRYILKEPKKIGDLFTKKKEPNSNKKNNKKNQLLLNVSNRARYGDNEQEISSSLTTFSSTKIDNQKKNNKLFPKENLYFNINTNDHYLGSYLNKDNKNCYFLNSNEYIVNNNMKKRLKNIIKIIGVDKKDEIDNYINNEINEKLELTICDKNTEFKTNPNLILKQRFFKVKNNTILEFYNSYHDNNELYVAMNENSILGSNIKIIKFKSRNFVTRLKRHKNRIIIIKHYFNYKKKQDFILSGDINHIVNIWNVSYKENPFIYYIKYNGNNIYNFVPVCIEEKNDIDYFLLIYDNTINMYHLNKGMFIKNINHFPCEEEKIINLLSWKNKNNKLDYIIKCTKHRIIIFNFIDEDIVFQLSNKIKNEKSNVIIQKVDSIYKSEGYIISNKTSDYLCIFTSDMNIEIWDLYSLSLKESISMKINLIDDIHLINFIPWNNKYTLIINGNYIYVFDIENKNIISKMIGCFRNTNRQIYYKKTTSNIYGQSLLFWCNNKYISLMSSNDFSLKIFD